MMAFSDSEIDFLVEHWHNFTEGDIGKRHGYNKANMGSAIGNLRESLKIRNDDRWKLLYRKGTKPLTELEERLIDTWADWSEGDIHKELGIPKERMKLRAECLRKKLRSCGDDRWKKLYRKKLHLREDQEWLAEHFYDGVSVIAEQLGLTIDAVRKRRVTLRRVLKRMGDNRLKEQKAELKPVVIEPIEPVKSDELPNHGNVPRPDTFIKKDANPDPRPDWLVINYTVGVV
jgi:hypothetical protein